MGEYVDTEELKMCLDEGFSAESTQKSYDITKEEYRRVITSKTNIKTKMGKNSELSEERINE